MPHPNAVVLNAFRIDVEPISVLVTGFEPFGKHIRNVSKDVVLKLGKSRHSALVAPSLPRCNQLGEIISDAGNGTTITWDYRVLSVDKLGSETVAKELRSESPPDWQAIIHLGLCESCDHPRLEIAASNMRQFSIADNSGRTCSSEIIIDGGPKEWNTTIAANRIPLESFTSSLSISTDAGSFICNETYAQTLNALTQVDNRDRLGRQLPTVFLHLPSEEKVGLDTQVKLVEEVVAWMVNRPILSVAAGVLSDADGRLLSCRRSPEEIFAGEWEFPGGKLEVGEDIPTCLKREFLEELGVTIEPLRPLCVHRVLSGPVEMELHAWEVAWVSGEIALCVHDKKRWLEVEELEGAKWIEADIAMISIIAEKLANQSR